MKLTNREDGDHQTWSPSLFISYPPSLHFPPVSDAEDGGPVALVFDRSQYHVNKPAVLFTYFFREKLLYIIFSDI